MDTTNQKSTVAPEAVPERLRADLHRATQQVERLEAEYNAALADPDVIQEDRDGTHRVLEEARQRLRAARQAVDRFEAGSYGLCEVCGRPIGEERLEALPGVTTCVSCPPR
jgi:RNA polymerase-binding transcription factor DksA